MKGWDVRALRGTDPDNPIREPVVTVADLDQYSYDGSKPPFGEVWPWLRVAVGTTAKGEHLVILASNRDWTPEESA